MAVSLKLRFGSILRRISVNWIDKILLLAVVFFSFYGLAEADIQRWDEYTNIEVVKETVQDSTLVDLVYKSSPFWEKPPLWYALTGLLVEVFGEDLIVFRLVSALSAVCLAGAVYWYLFRFHSKLSARIGVLLFLSIGQFWYVPHKYFSTHTFRSADLDALQLLCMLLQLLLIGIYLSKRNQKYLYFAVGFAGIALLIKGPVGLLPLFTLSIFELSVFVIDYRKPGRKTRLINLFKKYALTLAILFFVILPWHMYMYTKYAGEFWDEYVLYHLINRSLNPIEGHDNGMLYFLEIMLHPEMFVSLELVIVGLWGFLKSKIGNDLKYFLTGNLVMGFMIIQFVQTKLAWYVYYVYLPLLLIVPIGLSEFTQNKRYSRIWELLLGFGLLRIVFISPSIVGALLVFAFTVYLMVDIKAHSKYLLVVSILFYQVYSNLQLLI